MEHPLSLPAALEAALDRTVQAAPPDRLRRLAAWATRHVPASHTWSDLADLAEAAARGEVSPSRLAFVHSSRSGAACAATVCGLSKGIASAAAQLTVYGAVYPEAGEAARRALAMAYAWHVLSPEADADTFGEAVLAEVDALNP